MSEKNVGGRPAVGLTRKISITLPAAEWEYIDKLIEEKVGPTSGSAYFRLAHRHLRYEDESAGRERGLISVMGPLSKAVLRALQERAGELESALQKTLKAEIERMTRGEADSVSHEGERDVANE